MKYRSFLAVVSCLTFLASCEPLSGGGGGGVSVVAPAEETPEASVDPIVLGASPVEGSSSAFISDNVLVSFDVPLDPSSLTPSMVKVYETSLGQAFAHPGTISYDETTRSVVFDPFSDFNEVTNYTAQISGPIKSETGGTLQAPYSWSFNTRDQTPPVILGSVPPNNATNVSQTTSIVIQCNEPLDPSTLVVKPPSGSTGLTPIQFYQKDLPNVPLSATVNYTPGANEFSVVPGVQLLPLTDYTVKITGGIEDTTGNAMPASTNFVTNFKVKDYLFPTLSSPSNGGTGVPIDTTVTVAFNNAVNTATVNPNTFTLSGGVTTSVPIAFSGGDKFATFVPSSNLTPFTTYIVTLDGSIADTNGETLGTPKTFSFTTGESVTTWGAASAVETALNQADSETYQTVQAPNGDSFAIWIKNAIVWSARMPAGGAWGVPTQISNPVDGSIVMSPSIATDGDGNAMAVWIAGNQMTSGGSNTTRVYSLKYLATTGWNAITTRVSLTSTQFPAVGPTRIAMNTRGWAFAMWRRFVFSAAPGNQYQVYSKTFFPNPSFALGNWASGSSAEQKLQGSTQSKDADNLQLGIDGNQNQANGIAMWTQSGTVLGTHVYANKATAGSWGAATNIDGDTNDVAPGNLSLKVDLSGKALAVWSQGPVGARNIIARRFDGSSWETSSGIPVLVPLENQAGDARHPHLAMTESSPGNGIVVWEQADGGGVFNNIYVNRYASSSNSWQPAGVLVTAHAPAEIGRPNIVFLDALGNAIAVWREKTGSSSIWQIEASKFSALSDTWGAPTNLCADTTNDADLSSNVAPQIVGRANRNPVAFWSQKAGGTYTLWANVFR